MKPASRKRPYLWITGAVAVAGWLPATQSFIGRLHFCTNLNTPRSASSDVGECVEAAAMWGRLGPLWAGARGSKPSGFKTKKGNKARRKAKAPKPKNPDDAPDGEEEVFELTMPVEELVAFSEELEAAVKASKLKGSPGDGPPPVILNVTGMHWILSQVAYDIGVRRLAVPSLGPLRDAVDLLPDDVEWVLTGGLTAKSVRRIPAIKTLRVVYINNLEQAELLESALRHEEQRRAEKTPLQKVSSSRLKYLQKRDQFGPAGTSDESKKLTRGVALAPPETSSATDVIELANAIEQQCPRLDIWGLSLERCPDAVGTIGDLRSLLGRDPVVILGGGEGAKEVAKAATGQSLAWDSLVTMLTVRAPTVEEEGEGIVGEEDVEEYDPLTAEGDGVEDGEEQGEGAAEFAPEELLGVLQGDAKDEDFFTDDEELSEEEEEEMRVDGQEDTDGAQIAAAQIAAGDRVATGEQVQRRIPGQGPVSKGKGSRLKAKRQKKGGVEEEEDDVSGGAYGPVLDRKTW